MRDLPARRLASTVLCASVLVGVTGPAALAADAAREHGRAASGVSVPAATKESLLARARTLAAADPALNPVVDLLSRSLEQGRLPAAEAGRLGAAAKAAIARAAAQPQRAAPAEPAPLTAPTKPATASPAAASPAAASPAAASPTTAAKPATATEPAAPAKPASPAAPAGSGDPAALTAPMAARHAHLRAALAGDPIGDLLSALRTAIDDLVKAVTGGFGDLLTPATDVVSGLSDLLDKDLGTDLLGTDLTGTDLLDNATSAPSVVSLPSLPSLPALPALPVLPAEATQPATG